jgi:hypothetical protein
VRPKGYIANFDSTASMFRATSHYLKSKGHPNLGVMPRAFAGLAEKVASNVNKLPPRIREAVFTWGGGAETVPVRNLHKIDAEKLSGWAAAHYPRRRYPAIMVGSSNGAAVHLCSALGIPWLPQSFLIPVSRTGIEPDEPKQETAWSRKPARMLLDANPDVQLHNMLDPVQDLLMSRVLSYFRIKRLRLGLEYERFLEERLEPGGTIFVIECDLSWPTTKIGERHYFQFGALGGARTDEFFHGGKRVEEYLSRYHSYRKQWDPPEPDGESPEAEWGFAPQLREDVERFARKKGFTVRRIVFNRPEQMSPLVADLYQWWHKSRGLPANRLLVESFLLVEPFWTMRVGAVPFWTVFPTEPYDALVEKYIRSNGGIDDIGIMLFSHGVDSIGLVPIERWKELLKLARKNGVFVGVDEQAFPRDFSSMISYHTDIGRKFSARYPLPGPLALGQFDEFLQERQSEYEVQWQ